jgi:hypothetical protein
MARSTKTLEGRHKMPTMEQLKQSGGIPPAPRMIGQDTKEDWAAKGTKFDLYGMSLEQGDGERTYYFCTVKLGKEFLAFRLSNKGTAGQRMLALQAALESGPIEGCVLKSIMEKLGSQFLVID